MTLQEQAWASASPTAVLAELRRLHTLAVDGEKLTVSPPPSPRLTFQIKRYKPKLLELMGVGKTIAERIQEAQQKLGWKSAPASPDQLERDEERRSIQAESAYRGKSITFSYEEWDKPVQPPWPTPVIDRRVMEVYCQHGQAQQYRRKVDGTVVVQVLCPDCGRNMKGPRGFVEPRKRSTVPWWPKDTPIVPDPDAETDALVEWWGGVENDLVDGGIFSQGETIIDAKKCRRSINELIGLWKLGCTDCGLKAQLWAHKRYLEASKA